VKVRGPRLTSPCSGKTSGCFLFAAPTGSGHSPADVPPLGSKWQDEFNAQNAKNNEAGGDFGMGQGWVCGAQKNWVARKLQVNMFKNL
jgi:hypothetical protein